MRNKKFRIIVKKGTTTETVGSTSFKGVIKIEVGTMYSDIDLKYVCEHELMHLFQMQTFKQGNDTADHCPTKNKFWIEGQATYWGIESTKANFNLTNKQLQDEFKRVHDHNWYDHYTDINRTIFKGWGGSYSDYMGSYLFMKFLKERYGESNLIKMFNNSIDNYANDSKDVSPREAIAKVTGKSWETILAEFHAWLLSDAVTNNGVPERKAHVTITYSNNTVNDSIGVNPEAAGLEKVIVNGTRPFSINFATRAGTKWMITIVYVYKDGSRKKAFNTPFAIADTVSPWPVNPKNHDKELDYILVIKSLIKANHTEKINMTIVPLDLPSQSQPTELIPPLPYEWWFPPLFGNITDPADFPWRYWFRVNHNDTTTIPRINLNSTAIYPGGLINMTIWRGGLVITDLSLSTNESSWIMWDPTWPLDNYTIELTQGTSITSCHGTITLLPEPRNGTALNVPEHIGIGEVKPLDSDEWPLDSHYYYCIVNDTYRYLFELNIASQYSATADWYMELYHPGDPTPVATTQGMYGPGVWPRYLEIPIEGEAGHNPDDEYIVRVVYDGQGTGNISLRYQPISGASPNDPLWHVIDTTQYLSVSLPYTITRGVSVFINATVVASNDYALYLNSTASVFAHVWNGTAWIDFTYSAANDWYNVTFTADTTTICIEILPDGPSAEVLYLWSKTI